MVAPIDYTIDVQSPIEAALGGFKFGATIAELQARREAAQAEAAIKQQQQQAAIMAQQETDALYKNPNPRAIDFARVSSLLPKDQAENVRKGWEILSEEQKQAKLAQSGQVFSALRANAPDIAIKLLEEQAAANRNAGREEEAKAAETYIRIINFDPKRAADNIGTMLTVVPGGEKIIESAAKSAEMRRAEEMAPITMRKESALSAEAEEKAKQAAIKSRFAESEAVIDLEKKGWDIRKIQSDMAIAKQNAQIAAANVQIGKTTNDLKRQELELKVEDMKQKRDSTVREKAAEVESARFNIDNMLNTSQRILNNPSLNSVIGTIQGRTPVFLSDEAQDAVALIETLGSQAFLSQIPNVKGMGQLSNAEGDKLQNSLQNLSRVQSEKQFRENLQEATRLLKKARENVSMRFGVPETAPDIPAAKGAAASAAGNFTVTAPNGQTFTFPTKQAADQFRQAAGIR